MLRTDSSQPPLCSDHSPEELMELFSSVANELQFQAYLTADISASFASLGVVPWSIVGVFLSPFPLWGSYDILVCKVKIPGSDPCLALVRPFASSLLLFIAVQNSANFCSFWPDLTKKSYISRRRYKAVNTPGLFDLRAKSIPEVNEVISSHWDIPQQALANLPKPQCADPCRANAACGQ